MMGDDLTKMLMMFEKKRKSNLGIEISPGLAISVSGLSGTASSSWMLYVVLYHCMWCPSTDGSRLGQCGEWGGGRV